MSTQKNPVEMLMHWAKERPSTPWLFQPVNGQWKSYTWAEAEAQIRSMATALKGLGIPEGSAIGISGRNTAHWFFADLAIRTSRQKGAGEVIPRYDAVVFDEAHALEETASEHFGTAVSSFRVEELARDGERLVLPGHGLYPEVAAGWGTLRAGAQQLFATVAAQLPAGGALVVRADRVGAEVDEADRQPVQGEHRDERAPRVHPGEQGERRRRAAEADEQGEATAEPVGEASAEGEGDDAGGGADARRAAQFTGP